MKKIIYSLVIMIAAGSLFTSCIEPVEPAGLENLRNAKAEYLKALAQLQGSKTALVAAQAAAEQALAAQRTAEATYQTALANYQDALTAALNAKTDMDRQLFNLELQRLTQLYEDEALMRALEYDAAVAKLEALKAQYQAEAAEYAIQLAMMQAEVDYQNLLNEAQRIQNLKDQQEIELAKQAFEQEYGQQAALFALQLARYEAETEQMAAEAAALVAAMNLENEARAQEIAQAKAAFEQKYGYDEAMNALELARVEAANNAAAAEAQAKLEDLIDQYGYNAAMRILDLARQAVKDEADAQKYELEIKALEEAYNQQVAMDAIEIAQAQIELAKKQCDLEGLAATIENLKKEFEYAEIYRAYELQKAVDTYGLEALQTAYQIENLKMQQELNQVLFEQAIAEAKQSLKETLAGIELDNIGLTDAEKERIADAIADYEEAYDAYLDQQVVVMGAEAQLFNAQYAQTHPSEDYYVYLLEEDWAQHAGLYTVNFAPTVANYQAAIEILRGFIETDKEAIAQLEEKGLLPNNDDLLAWAAELQAWKDQMDQNQYYLYANTQDSINYVINTYHDGMAAVAKAVLDWAQEHPMIDAPTYPDEPVEPDYDAITVDDMPADTLEFPVLELAEGDSHAIDKLSNFSFKKLFHMLDENSDYFHYGFLEHNAPEGELTIENVTRKMRDFILGAAELTALDELECEDEEGNTYYGYFGLEGVYAALAREKVMRDKDDSWKQEAEDNYNKYKEAWEEDYEILKNKTIGEYQPFIDALADYKDAKDELDAAKAEAAAHGDAMVNALNTLRDRINEIAGHTSMTVNDSTVLLQAIKDFAAAREAYFPASAAAKAETDVYNYASASSPVTAAQVAYADLDWNTVRTNQDRGAYGVASIYAFGPENGKAYWSKHYDNDYETLAAGEGNPLYATILEQAINWVIAQKFIHDPVYTWTNKAMINEDEYKALYGEFKYVAETSDTPEHFETLAGDPIVDPAVAAAEAAVEAAKTKVTKAMNDYLAIYNRFWAENATYNAAVNTALDNYFNKPNDTNKAKLIEAIDACLPLDVNCYTLATFTDPTTCVYFYDDIDEIENAEDLNAVLTAVDPRAEGNREGIYGEFKIGHYNQAQILFGRGSWNNPTEFTLYLYWKQMYEESNVNLQGDLEILREWIDGVIAVFDAADTQAEEDLEAYKEQLKEEYEEAVAAYEEEQAAAEAQQEARDERLAEWAEFFGTYDNPMTGEVDTLAYVWLNDKECQWWSVEEWRRDFSTQKYQCKYVDEAAGVWNGPQEDLRHNLIGGTFQEILDENIPGYPEKVAQWNAFARQYTDIQYHLRTIYRVMNDAYMAAAKVVDPNADETDLITYVAEYKAAIQYAIADLYEEINEHTAEIEWFNYAIASLEAGVDPFTVAAEVAKLNLEYEQQVLADLKVKLDLAQKEYDDVMAYIQAKSETAE